MHWEHPWPCCAAVLHSLQALQELSLGSSSCHSCWDSGETLCDAEGPAVGTGAPAMAGQRCVALTPLRTEQRKKGSIRCGKQEHTECTGGQKGLFQLVPPIPRAQSGAQLQHSVNRWDQGQEGRVCPFPSVGMSCCKDVSSEAGRKGAEMSASTQQFTHTILRAFPGSVRALALHSTLAGEVGQAGVLPNSSQVKQTEHRDTKGCMRVAVPSGEDGRKKGSCWEEKLLSLGTSRAPWHSQGCLVPSAAPKVSSDGTGHWQRGEGPALSPQPESGTVPVPLTGKASTGCILLRPANSSIFLTPTRAASAQSFSHAWQFSACSSPRCGWHLGDLQEALCSPGSERNTSFLFQLLKVNR